MATETLIRCAVTRVQCGDETGAARMRGLLPAVSARLPSLIDAMLPDALAAAGLPPGAAVAIRQLDVKVDIDEGNPAEAVAEAWAEAVRLSLVAQLVAAAATGPAAAATAPDADTCVYADEWRADMAVLAAIARGDAQPWWASGERAAAILARWIAADPGRAAAMLVELVLTAPTATPLPLAEHEAAALALSLEARLRTRLAELTQQPAPGEPASAPVPGDGAPRPAFPAALSVLLGSLPPEAARLYALAADLVFAPARASAAAVSPLPARPAPPAPAPLPSANAAIEAAQVPQGQPGSLAPEPDPLAVQPIADVFGGGLLMLLRPLIGLMPAREISSERLGGIGLAVLRRCLGPLPATACRLALERDRWLLAVFAGAPLPDVPLDRLPADPAAEDWIDQLTELLPQADWAPSALRRIYGGAEPFRQTPGIARLARVVMRPGLLMRTLWSAELIWPLETADPALRRAGWDLDPGWVPWIGRTIAFRFGDAS